MGLKAITAGVDVGGTNTVFGLVNEAGEILAESEFNTVTGKDFDSQFDQLAAGIKELLNANKDYELKGVGMGLPNANYYTGQVENPPNLGWGMVNVVEEMQSRLDAPVVITNDANAAALGEMRFGGARDMKNFVMITVGTGLGSGIVVNGQLLYGAYGNAGEVGHINVVPGGRKCACGDRGCLETYVSAPGVCRTALELMAEYTNMSKLGKITPRELTAKDVHRYAEKGDRVAQRAFLRTGEYLGAALADVVAVIEPEAIFLFGGLANAGKWIVSPTIKSLNAHLFHAYKGKVRILLSALQGKNIAVLGSSALAWHELENR